MKNACFQELTATDDLLAPVSMAGDQSSIYQIWFLYIYNEVIEQLLYIFPVI